MRKVVHGRVVSEWCYIIGQGQKRLWYISLALSRYFLGLNVSSMFIQANASESNFLNNENIYE